MLRAYHLKVLDFTVQETQNVCEGLAETEA